MFLWSGFSEAVEILQAGVAETLAVFQSNKAEVTTQGHDDSKTTAAVS